jgi:mannitol operon repressor
MAQKTEKPNPADDWDGFYQEFQQETPRAAVIVGASFLDAHLRKLIANFLIADKKEIDEFLGSDGNAERPLSTFSARIRGAYCLGLISKDEYHDLNIVRKIRNKFAHRLHDLSFDDQEIVSWCQALYTPKKFLPPDWVVTHRDLFVAAMTTLATHLALRALAIERERRVVPRAFELAQHIRVGDNTAEDA